MMRSRLCYSYFAIVENHPIMNTLRYLRGYYDDKGSDGLFGEYLPLTDG
jgi:hypothetical protein